MAPSPQGDGWGNNFFALGCFTVENIGGGRLYGGKCCFLVLGRRGGGGGGGGGEGVTRGLVVSIHLKENVPVVNINFLHMA